MDQTVDFRRFWLTDEYQTYDLTELYRHNARKLYECLLDDLYQELGTEEVIKRIDTMLKRLTENVKKAYAENWGIGNRKADLEELVETLNEYPIRFGFKHTDAHYAYEGEITIPTEEDLDFCCYIAALVLNNGDRYTCGDGTKLLRELKKGKHKKAIQYLSIGTGAIDEQDAVWTSELAECTANDVLNTVTFKIHEENEETYRCLLEFLLNLMKTAFPGGFKIKINSERKDFLPVKALSKSDNHKFFYNCACYPALYPLIEQFVRIATKGMAPERGNVRDAGAGRSTSGLAMLTLAFASPDYADLFAAYMQTNERHDHNIFPDEAITCYLKKWGVRKENIAAVLQCINWHPDLRVKGIDFSPARTAESLKSVNEHTGMSPYALERFVKYTWGSKEKLQAAINESDGEQKSQLELLASRL